MPSANARLLRFGGILTAVPLQINSPAFQADGRLPAANTCDGTAGIPPLVFSGVPPGAKSLALVFDDPDVPWILQSNHLFVHWITWDLPPNTTGIPAGKAQGGTEYVDPCPPWGEHRYVFKLFALDTTLGPNVDAASEDGFYAAMRGHIIEQAQLVSHYSRPESQQTYAPFYAVGGLAFLVLAGGFLVWRGARGLLRSRS
jgi:Raf kinase inhibitor-like YbhB/YbcL family protein